MKHSKITVPSQSSSRGQSQFCAQLQDMRKDVCGKAAIPCPTMTSYLVSVSHTFCQDIMLCHESLAFDHKDPASISQQVTEKQPDQGFGPPKSAVLLKCVLHTPFQSADKDFPPSCVGKDHSQPETMQPHTITSTTKSNLFCFFLRPED